MREGDLEGREKKKNARRRENFSSWKNRGSRSGLANRENKGKIWYNWTTMAGDRWGGTWLGDDRRDAATWCEGLANTHRKKAKGKSKKNYQKKDKKKKKFNMARE